MIKLIFSFIVIAYCVDLTSDDEIVRNLDFYKNLDLIKNADFLIEQSKENSNADKQNIQEIKDESKN